MAKLQKGKEAPKGYTMTMAVIAKEEVCTRGASSKRPLTHKEKAKLEDTGVLTKKKKTVEVEPKCKHLQNLELIDWLNLQIVGQ
ncbi:hypothetical protein ACLOJK_021575 [Asimina triloba]